MPDQRILYTEEMVGANHPTKADTLNRLGLVEHNNDGTHKAGFLLAPYVSALPGCRVRNSGAISVPNATDTFLTFNTEDFDNQAMHDTAVNPGRITIPVAGVYLAGGGVAWAYNAAGERRAFVRLNGTDEIGSNLIAVTTATGPQHDLIIPARKYSAGDYIELGVRQDSGGALSVVVAGNVYSPVFWAYFLGG